MQIQGAGRTDAGVHALAQTAHLESSKKINPETLRIGINDNLPASINVLQVENAPPLFHARHHAVSRSYLYLIAKRRTAFGKRYVWWIKDNLHINKMQQALNLFQGFHDFASFADKRMDKETSTKVNIEGLWLKEFDDIIAMRVVRFSFSLENGAAHCGDYGRGWPQQFHQPRYRKNAQLLFGNTGQIHRPAFRSFSGKSIV